MRSLTEQVQARHQIAVMEAVLERAVQLRAQVIGRQTQSLSPNLLLFSGPARARGFRLDGYGVFFDVELPALPRTIAWSFRTLGPQEFGIGNALRALRHHVRTISDERARTELEQVLRRLEAQVGSVLPETPAQPAASPSGVAASTRSAVAEAPQDPVAIYFAQVKEALIDVMLDHSGPIALGTENWLTVAARDNEDRLAPGEISDSVTIILRIRGSDLAGFRAGRLNRDEAIRRVEVREF